MSEPSHRIAHTAWEEATMWDGRSRQASPSNLGQKW